MIDRFWRLLSRTATRHPYLWIALSLAVSVPAWMAARHLGLDTNLKRLLPEHSPSVRWSRELESAVGDGGYFSILIEGDDKEVLEAAIEDIASRVRALPTVQSVEFKNPVDFIDRYKYTLVPNTRLGDFQAVIDDWEIEVNPFLIDLDSPDPSADEAAQESDGKGDDEDERLDRLLDYYANIDLYQSNPDKTTFGMIIRTREGISNLAHLRTLYGALEEIAGDVAEPHGLWWGISGNLRTRVDEFDLISADLGRAGAISLIAILLTLGMSFCTIRILPVLVYPLVTGLLWAFAFVPTLVGDLNTITAFLLLVLFGMGVDYSIHLISRFQVELMTHEPEVALFETLRSTGRSILTAAATTSLGLLILAISDFRGFSDFGIIGGSSIAIVALAMIVVLPPTAIAGQRLGLVRPCPLHSAGRRIPLPSAGITLAAALLVVVSMVVATLYLSFDYDFTNLRARIPGKAEIQKRQEKVYPATSAPAAIYIARDLTALDRLLEVLEAARDNSVGEPHIGTINSLRDFAPNEAHFKNRLQTIGEMRRSLQGRWVRRIEDEDKIEVIEDFLAFDPPAAAPLIADVPPTIVERLTARDDSGELIVGIDTNGRSRDGRMAMAFTKDLYALKLPDGVRGPTGDKPILAEILWLVTEESPRIIGLTLLGVFLLVAFDRRSLAQAMLIMTPLLAGLGLAMGAMIVLGWKLNFFNMVVLPSLLGVGVDHGVHYYRRWRELGRDTQATQDELFVPLTVCSLTTVMGYLGMVFAHHPGLRSIGDLALVGLVTTWFTALVLFPGLLQWMEQRHRRSTSESS